MLMDNFTSDEEDDTPAAPTASSTKPWQREFRLYLDGQDTVPAGMPLIKWWGVHIYLFLFMCACELMSAYR